jgi:hypothetical protein
LIPDDDENKILTNQRWFFRKIVGCWLPSRRIDEKVDDIFDYGRDDFGLFP